MLALMCFVSSVNLLQQLWPMVNSHGFKQSLMLWILSLSQSIYLSSTLLAMKVK